MKRLFKFCMLFFLCFNMVEAQQDTKRHKVVRGENIIQIAKKYNVTPYDIQQANSETLTSLDDIKENDILVIPKSKIITPQLESASDAIKSSATTRLLTYTVKKGETKYGLAKRYGISISELESSNPHIISGLNEGHILKVNTAVEHLTEPETNLPEKKVTDITFDGYKDHLVLKGETLWGISHANGLTVEQLVGENTDILTGILREGQTLKIPQVKEEKSPYETYLVKYGDTKYGLSKKFETTIEQLEQLNPHIIRMLKSGHSIRIPSDEIINPANEPSPIAEIEAEVPREAPNEEPILVTSPKTLTETEKEVIQDDASTIDTKVVNNESSTPETPLENTDQPENTNFEGFDSYEIKPKETLFGLSKKAGMSVSDFLVLNPQLKESVQVGMVIKMPKSGTTSNQQGIQKAPETTISSSRYKDLTKTINIASGKKVLFVFPFSETDFNENNFTNAGKNTDDFIDKHSEFYSGAKMAIDSIKRLGINLDVEWIEVENDKTNSKIIAESFNLQNPKNYDAIILPYYETVSGEVANILAKDKVPVITTATILHQQNVDNLYSSLPSINQQREKILDYMVSKEGNIIVVSDVNRSESRDFISAYVPYAKFVDLKKNGTFSENDLISLFRKDKMNYFILDSERNSVFLNVTNVLLSELNNYTLQLAVLEPTLIPDNTDVSSKRFRILKMLFPSLVPAESNLKTEKFEKDYKKIYNLLPTTNALMGFDITFDSLLRLSQEYNFETSARQDITEHTKLKFNYKLNTLGGYSNDGIYILQYDTDSNLQEAD